MLIPEILRKRLSPRRRLEWYPPLHAMRVRVLELDQGWRRVRLLLPLAPNRNPGGGMFGGAMACLADPIAALACNHVFPGHKVWTRALTLDFTREGRTDMELRFVFEPGTEDDIRDQLRERGRSTPAFEYAFFDTNGRACATVRCRVAIRSADYYGHEAEYQEKRMNEEEGLDMDMSSGVAAFESKQFSTATRLLAPRAEQGDPEAQYRMAIMAQNGLGMVENPAMALRYMQAAAESGMGLAQHGLGFMFMQGECVEQDGQKALEWFTKAAEQGLQGAMTTIGMMYRDGTVLERDEEKAREWFRKAGFDEF